MNHPVTQNQILNVVMSLNTDQRVDVLNYVSKVQHGANINLQYKLKAMAEIKKGLSEDLVF